MPSSLFSTSHPQQPFSAAIQQTFSTAILSHHLALIRLVVNSCHDLAVVGGWRSAIICQLLNSICSGQGLVVICLSTIEQQLLGQIFDIILLWSRVAGPLSVNDRTSSCCGQQLVVS